MGHPMIVAVIVLVVLVLLVVFGTCWEKRDFIQREKEKQEIKEKLAWFEELRK